jgi:general secretion pathway protein H
MCLLPKYFLGYCKARASSNRGQRTTNDGHPSGFTLLELIVVISLLGIMLVLAVPRFHETLFLDESKTNSRWVIGKIQALKEAAVRNQKNYTLHIDLDSERFWETDESMSPEAIENAGLNATSLPSGLKIISGQAEITFYKMGYSDEVFIHLQEGESQVSYRIEPFLSEVGRYENYIGFEN